jgi:ADP-ribosylglycohydrolase
MVSDDTEHTIFVAQALLANSEPDAFARSLAWKLRWWLLGIPAGIGFATLRATLKSWVGFPPSRSGVHSAGNGPAMRSAIIGALFADDPNRIKSFVHASTKLTHTDERALTGALAVAFAAAWTIRQESKSEANMGNLLPTLRALSDNAEWLATLAKLESALEGKFSVADFAAELGCSHRVSGYMFHTVPVALFAWLRHWGDFRAAIASVIRCGGDTDTVAAICGALAGCSLGVTAIPVEWRDGIRDWPRSVRLLGEIATRLGNKSPNVPVRYFWPGVIPRNLLFLLLVLFHAFRRALPPY